MGIQVEFSPELALRNIKEFKEGRRKKEECVPENMQPGEVYEFLKSGQRLYWLNDEEYWYRGEMPLTFTSGDGQTASAVASIKMLEVTHFLQDGKIFTKGKYRVIDVFDPDDGSINFNSCRRVK